MKDSLVFIFGFIIFYSSLVFSQSETPSIVISGEIDSRLNLGFTVQYKTTKENWWCKDYVVMAGLWVSERENYSYSVVAGHDGYRVKIPLAEKKLNSFCRWVPDIIFFKVKPAGNPELSAVKGAGGSMISVWKNDGVNTNTIEYECNVVTDNNSGVQRLQCLYVDSYASLVKTIRKEQDKLVVNFKLFIQGE